MLLDSGVGVYAPKPRPMFCALFSEVVRRDGGWIARWRRRGDCNDAPSSGALPKA